MKPCRLPLLPVLFGAFALPPSLDADEASLPGAGFSASHYEVLWTHSPFAVASSETTASESPDYALVGIAQFDGVSYASLIDKKNQEHFILSGDKTERGMKLLSVTQGKDADGTFAVVQKDGAPLTLKLETAATPAPGLANAGNPAVPSPQIPMPGAAILLPPMTPNFPPLARFRSRVIRIPPLPVQNQMGAHGVSPQPVIPHTGLSTPPEP
jgi:hypothetical protein